MDRRVAFTLACLAALATAAAGAGALTAPPPVRVSPAPRVVLRGVPISDRVVAITVDDGPSPVFTPQVLEVLERHGALATFFPVGESVREFPDIVRETRARGHEVETHTWSHPHMGRISAARTRAEVRRGAQAVQRVIGSRPGFFRPPRGVTTTTALEAVASQGMRAVTWNVCLDHRGDRTASEAAARVLAKVGPGDVILLHDGRGDRTRTVAALDLLLTQLEARGYRFVTLSELYRRGRT